MMRALVIGATGAVGKDLVKTLAEDSAFESVDIFVRHQPETVAPKVKVHIVDFNHPEQWEREVTVDVAFSCMGTSLKQAGSKAAQWKVDHDYQMAFAHAAKTNGVKKFIIVSSIGASKDSKAFYLQMKGTIDEEVRGLRFPTAIIIRPASLIREHTKRWTETASVVVLKVLNAIGLLRSMRPIPTLRVARAMANLAKETGSESYRIISSSELWKIS